MTKKKNLDDGFKRAKVCCLSTSPKQPKSIDYLRSKDFFFQNLIFSFLGGDRDKLLRGSYVISVNDHSKKSGHISNSYADPRETL